MNKLLDEVSGTMISTVLQWILNGIGALTLFLLGIESISDPFYHGGWWENYKAWGFVFVALFLGGVWLCLTSRGIWALLALIASSFIFAIPYGTDLCSFANCAFIAWVAHGVAIALFFPVVGWLLAVAVSAAQQWQQGPSKGRNSHNEP